MTDDERDRAIRSLYTLYSEIASRIEALRLLGKEGGVFTQAAFDHAVQEVESIARQASAQALADHQPERLGSLLEQLKSPGSKPQ